MPYPLIYRLVVIGGERVGKTAIIEQLIFGNHVIGQVSTSNSMARSVSYMICVPLSQGGLPTIGDIYDIVVETEKGSNERLQIFDTPGSVSNS